MNPLLIRNIFTESVDVAIFSRKSSPETRNPLSTKNRSTPTQPPLSQTSLMECSNGLAPSGQTDMCRPSTRSIANVRITSSALFRELPVIQF